MYLRRIARASVPIRCQVNKKLNKKTVKNLKIYFLKNNKMEKENLNLDKELVNNEITSSEVDTTKETKEVDETTNESL
ncbi:MAG: hypothetical protein BWY04_00295 [candidate division CPR1 bacterium ADurb.Bin160]|uniref:Uncharacterized protein n=1 Tax=candidate division CPR1 bacterium ADurb.Bin160 TaxID=1852826 RepID=A0A1V5ZQ24_9BACT|nr:MAG: hypothetical protein BWY04_00295 [candidate division CPR1 bacterium ADurb.Bin160]